MLPVNLLALTKLLSVPDDVFFFSAQPVRSTTAFVGLYNSTNSSSEPPSVPAENSLITMCPTESALPKSAGVLDSVAGALLKLPPTTGWEFPIFGVPPTALAVCQPNPLKSRSIVFLLVLSPADQFGAASASSIKSHSLSKRRSPSSMLERAPL